MSETKHTPGPWAWNRVNYSKNLSGELTKSILISHERGYIARLFSEDGGFGLNSHAPSNDQADANARLIAAAPTLLAEMQRYLPVLEALECDPTLWIAYTKGTGIATTNGYRAALAAAEPGMT